MPRYQSSPRTMSYTFGPGPLTPVIKILVWTNGVCFLATWLIPSLTLFFGLRPDAVLTRGFLWQPVTYMFLHAGFFHILFNMLALWMFGVELERMWGRSFFLKYYFITGIGAALTTMALALLPGAVGVSMRYSVTVGASGAIYGLLLAYALYFPDRPIYMWAILPIPAKYFVMIMGAIALMSSIGGNEGGVANSAHLGGLVFGYAYLRLWRKHPLDELKYRYVKWRMNRLRRKFEVHSGGRNDWDRKVH